MSRTTEAPQVAATVASPNGSRPPGAPSTSLHPPVVPTAKSAAVAPLVSVVSVDGIRWVRSRATSALAVARSAGTVFDENDRVTWAPHTTPAPGADPADLTAGARAGRSVSVVTVERRAFTSTAVIEPPTRKRTDAAVPAGEHVVVSAGTPGEVRTRTVVVSHDGDVVRREKRVVSKVRPTPRVIAVGLATDTRARTSANPGPEVTLEDTWPTVPGTAQLNWTALAECESSNNPRATNPAGYFGLFQFNLGTWASVGGTGNPRDASPAEQLHRAQLLYASRGAQPWPVCGQRL